MNPITAALGLFQSKKQPEGIEIRGAHNQPDILLDDSILRAHMAISGRQSTDLIALTEQLLSQQTARGRGWVFIDAVGAPGMRDRLLAQANAIGRVHEFYVLDFDSPATSNTYDMLRDGTPDDLATRVLQLIPDVSSPGATYYIKPVQTLLIAFFAACQASGRALGLRHLSSMLTSTCWHKTCVELLSSVPMESPEYTQLRNALEPLKINGAYDLTARNRIFASLVPRLQNLLSSNACALIDTAAPEISFEDILTNNKICFIQLPRTGDHANKLALARLLLHDIQSATTSRGEMRDGQARLPFMAIFGSFQDYGMHAAGTSWATLPSYRFAHARGLSVCFVPVIHENWDWLADTNIVGVEVVAANTWTKICFAQQQSKLLNSLHASAALVELGELANGDFVIFSGDKLQRARSTMPASVNFSAHTPAPPKRQFARRCPPPQSLMQAGVM